MTASPPRPSVDLPRTPAPRFDRRHILPLPIGLALVILTFGAGVPAAESEEAPGAGAVCVIAPHLQSSGSGEAIARLPFGDPTVFAAGGFEEILVEQDGRVLWRRQARSLDPIEGPIPWPLPPIRPGESLRLRLRPSGAGVGNFAVITLTGAPAAEMTRAAALRHRLGKDPGAWLTAVQAAIDRGDLPVALALLFAYDGPSAPALNDLRLDVFQRACGGGSMGEGALARTLAASASVGRLSPSP